MIRQELNPETCRLEMKHAKLAGTSERRPFLISQIKASVFVSARLAMIPGTPCTRFKKGEDRRKKKREVLHLLRCYTHTLAQNSHCTQAELSKHLYKISGLQTTSIEVTIESGERE